MKALPWCILRIALTSIAGTTTAVYAEELKNPLLEEIVITAQKRSQSIQDVPIAISAVNSEMIYNTGTDEIDDIIMMIPGFTGTSTAGTLNFWAIRGIASTDFTIGSEPSVGVYLNDGYIGRNVLALGAFYDVERIEVVKGPQGTLFGRNSVAGAISIYSRKPEDETTVQLGAGFGNEGQEEYDLIGNLAVNPDLAFRLAYHGTRLEGVMEDILNNKDANIDEDAARLSALWNPTSQFEAFATLDYSTAQTGVIGGPYNPRLQPLNETPTPSAGDEYPDKVALGQRKNEENIDTTGAMLKLIWDLDNGLTLTSISDYHDWELDLVFDVDASQADTFLGTSFFGFPIPISLEFDRVDVSGETYSQEFRVNGANDQIDWFVGVSYFEEDVRDRSVASVLDIDGLLGGDLNDTSRVRGKTESIGVYGDASWSFGDSWTITTGVRWSQDKKDWCAFGKNTTNALGAIDTLDRDICGDEKWSEVTPRAVVNYFLGEDVMVYASVAKGYKGGGFNTPTRSTDNSNDLILSALLVPTGDTLANRLPNTAAGESVFYTGEVVSSFDPETILAYELGFKGTFLDQALQLNGATFINDYRDLQVQNATASGIITENAAEAETMGMELDFVYAASSSLAFMGNYTYLDAQFQDGIFVGMDISGNKLAYAPEHSYSASVSWDFDVSAGTLTLFSVYSWQDDTYHKADNADNLIQQSYGLWDAKATFRAASERWDVYASIDNITDEEYATSLQDINIGTGAMVFRGLPRLWKLGANVYF